MIFTNHTSRPGLIMRASGLTAALFLITFYAQAQTDFRCDNIVYKTLYPSALCNFLKANPDALLIDVRTPGEFSDTSAHKSMNIGHLSGARNMELDSLDKYLPGLKKDIKRPVVVYCSHSQRSRRASKALKEAGMINVYNVNGGLSWLSQVNTKDFPCKKEMIISTVRYKNVSAAETIELLKSNKDMLIIDTRQPEAFAGMDTAEMNNTGRIRKAVNIPAGRIGEIAASGNKPILVYDEEGHESADAAAYLASAGFSKVYHLQGGLAALVGKDKETLKTRRELMEGLPSYHLLNPREAATLIKAPGTVIIDTRPAAEYTNKSDLKWRNLGHIRGAIHIDPALFSTGMASLEQHKKAAVLVYGGRDAARLAKMLKDAGFMNVSLLYGGLWNFVSASFNVQGMEDLQLLMTDHNGLY